MNTETLDRANELIKQISRLQSEITIWEDAQKFEDNVRVSDYHKLTPINISEYDFEDIKDYMLSKLRKRLAEAEKQFASL